MARALDRFRLALLTSFSTTCSAPRKRRLRIPPSSASSPPSWSFTTLLALTPESDTVRGEMRAAFAEVLPVDTMTLLHAYFTTQKLRGVRASPPPSGSA